MKTLQDYIDSHDGDHEKAIKAVYSDLAMRAEEADKATAKLSDFEKDNKALRDTRRELRAKVQSLEDSMPGEDVVAQLEAYKALGKVDELSQLSEKSQQLERRLTIRDVADAMSWNYAALSELDSVKGVGLTYQIVGGDDGKRVMVANGDGKAIPLSEYAEKNWSIWMPSIAPATEPEKPQGTPYPAQRRADGNPQAPSQQRLQDERSEQRRTIRSII